MRYFVMGENQWHDSEVWPPAAESTSFYLDPSNAEASKATSKSDARQSLKNSRAGSNAFSSFPSDPADPVINPYASSGAHDYRDFVNRKDVLNFDSASLEHDLEVTGPILADIFLSCDCRDVDLWVELLDVAPGGTAFNLMSPGLGVLRASYRDIKQKRQLLKPGDVYELRLDNLITSNVFAKGHRIRVQISASFFPDFSRNPQTGESESTSAGMNKATVKIYHDDQHASRVILPIVER